MNVKHRNAKDKLNAAMNALAESVYEKLDVVDCFAESDADILSI